MAFAMQQVRAICLGQTSALEQAEVFGGFRVENTPRGKMPTDARVVTLVEEGGSLLGDHY